MKMVSWRLLGQYIFLTLIPAIFLQLTFYLNNLPFSISRAVLSWIAVVTLSILGVLGMPICQTGKRLFFPWTAGAGIAAGLLAITLYLATESTLLAWLWVFASALLLLWVETIVSTGLPPAGWRPVARFFTSLGFAGVFGFLQSGIWMLESRFSEEEFFVAVQAAVFAVLWWMLWLAVQGLLKLQVFHPPRPFASVQVNLPVTMVCFAFAVFGYTVLVVRQYQASFYPAAQETFYPGIKAQAPILCDAAEPDSTTYDGLDIWNRFLKLVGANPEKSTPEFGMLALGTGDQKWAALFRETLLSEVQRADYTGPANSVKIGQYYTALRAYYYPKVRDAFPDLFSQAEQNQVREWFAAVNRRSLMVEWVDWMYAAAFTRIPEGPYENQENGAALLAMLEANNLSDPALSQANRAYLQRNPRGWQARFRNTDDAITYQPIWINNAYFQSLYTGQVNDENLRLSFEWLLAQALPRGENLQYNHPKPTSFIEAAYLGAKLLKDERLLWLVGQGISVLEEQGGYLEAQPGVEQPVILDGGSPEIGACLIYGDSGLPNQLGPLTQDKVVIRNGWGDQAYYLIENLRFTGWHRYKATNTITLFYNQKPFVSERLNESRVTWLPYGRSHLRDKRIPRENLNGLSIERIGLSRVFYTITGVGSRWEQDPPFLAQVIDFQVNTPLKHVWTAIQDWHGWQHDREIFATEDGLVVVVDTMQGPEKREAALFWHILGQEVTPERVKLGQPWTGEELLLLPEAGQRVSLHEAMGDKGIPNLEVSYAIPQNGRGRLISVFLTGAWQGAAARVDLRQGAEVLLVTQAGREMEIPLQKRFLEEGKRP